MWFGGRGRFALVTLAGGLGLDCWRNREDVLTFPSGFL
jgi:hypothetical protein